MTAPTETRKIDPLKEARARFERRYVEGVIRVANGNMSEAARIAGVDRVTLYRMVERLGLTIERPAGVAA